MAVAIRIPTQLRALTGGTGEVYVDATNVSDALIQLNENYPGFNDRLLDESGAIRRFVNVFVNDEDIRFLDGPKTEVATGQTISIVPAVAGG